MTRRKSKLGAYSVVPRNTEDTVATAYEEAQGGYCQSAIHSLVEAARLSKNIQQFYKVTGAVPVIAEKCVFDAKLKGLGRRPSRRRR